MIHEGNQVILRKEGVLKAIEVRKSRKVQFERLHFSLDNAVGCPLGSVFEVAQGQMHRVDVEQDVNALLKHEGTGVDRSNRLLVQDGSSQKLSKDDIMCLKANGMSGQDIVEHLVENSATFKDRTHFSQAKYRDKKKKKHVSRITVMKPTTSLVAECCYSRGSTKICDLRPDTLSQILTLANVRAHSRMLVMENCQGLVVGALLDRMGGFGKLIQVYSGDFPARQATACFDFPPPVLEPLSGFPLNKVNTLASNPGQTKKQATSEELHEEQEMSTRLSKRMKEDEVARKELENGHMDGLVVACRFQPSPLLEVLLPFLAPSRPFVVYCQFKEPLMECYVNLKEKGQAINIQLRETWWRHYQVLPARSHPEITMSSTGGYLLTGLSVDTCPENHAKKLKLNQDCME